MPPFNRREALKTLSVAALAAATPLGRAQSPDKLNVLAHNVHRIVSTGKQGGDITEAFTKRTGAGINWITFDIGPLRERLFREASLGETTIDVGFLLNTMATPATATLFEPLDDLMKAEPLEDFADLFPGMVEALRFGGRLYGIPFRHSTSGLHYNEELFAERGLSGPPRTIEQLADYAKKLTYKRADGSQVVGFVIPGVHYANVVDIARVIHEGDDPDRHTAALRKRFERAKDLLRRLATERGLVR